MNHREFEDKVAAYIEGALSGEPLREMEAHRAACQKCARIAELHEAMFAALNDSPPVRAPRGLADRILAAAGAEETVPAGTVVPFPSQRAGAITHETFERQIAAYLDGTLERDTARRMAEHRRTCAACARVAAIHETVAASLNHAEPLHAPEGLAERIFAAAAAAEVAEETQSAVKVRIRLFERFGAALAGTGALVAAMVMLGNVIWSRLAGTGTWLDAAQGGILAFFPMIHARVASMLPAQWIVRLQMLATPVTLPYTSVSMPVYYFAPLLILAAAMVYYLHQTSAETAEAELF